MPSLVTMPSTAESVWHELEAVALAVAQKSEHAELERAAPQLGDRPSSGIYHARQGTWQ